MKNRTFIIGDIHGAKKALVQCLQRSGFNNDTDRLIFLGDVCDGYPEVKECIEELLSIKNLIHLLGNHDKWSLKWMDTGEIDYLWYFQGGKWTMQSYNDGVIESHKQFLSNAKDYHIENDVLFAHAGYNPDKPFDENIQDNFIWDRKMFTQGLKNQFKKVYVGHTSVAKITTRGNITGIDTGCGHGGRLTMMNIDTGEVFVSDKTSNLYPYHEPRG